MKEGKLNMNITGVQVLNDVNSDVLVNIGINDKYLIQFKNSGFYIPSSSEDFWGQNRAEQDGFKENFTLENIINELKLNGINSKNELMDFCEENCILIEEV